MSFSLSIQPRPIDVAFTIGTNLIPQGLEYSQGVGEQCIITNETLLPYLPPLPDPIVLPSHGTIKNHAMKEWIEDILYERGANSNLIIVAIGGGELLDLVGFVSSTFMRGVPYISFPTTLLAMTDAAIGGKTGINMRGAKNWIGAYHHPSHIYIDLNFLQSLPQDVWIDGLAESIKHGIIEDPTLFSFFENNLSSIFQREQSVVLEMIKKSVSVKCRIVEQDPYEQLEIRSILNFGHTVGHAIESVTRYKCTHGKAIAMGMLVETAMSHRLGLLDQSSYDRIFNLIQKIPFGFEFPKEPLYKYMLRDKKNGRFAALNKVGDCKLANFDESLFNKGWNDALRDSQTELTALNS